MSHPYREPPEIQPKPPKKKSWWCRLGSHRWTGIHTPAFMGKSCYDRYEWPEGCKCLECGKECPRSRMRLRENNLYHPIRSKYPPVRPDPTPLKNNK